MLLCLEPSHFALLPHPLGLVSSPLPALAGIASLSFVPAGDSQ